ncbi:hypothetical protein JVU11DRAFT_3770 [Chiua virens]|nr:hypothetical protein JVU11DRAFT_3770 [Chiua virens]
MSEQRQSSIHSSLADVWYLKQITFGTGRVKIITQNFNGSVSSLHVLRTLIPVTDPVRSSPYIEILPHDRTTVSYEFLSQLVGEYLLISCPDIDISAALSIMPSTTKGLDLNPRFTSVTAFSPASDVGELDLFAKAGIQLVHGWVVDPESPEAEVMTQIRDYDNAVTLIADADYITKGRLLGGADEYVDNEPQAGGSSSTNAGPVAGPHTPHSDEDQRKIEHGQSQFTLASSRSSFVAILAQHFLDATKSQLTYHGLFQLASTLQPGSLVALFRNAHLSVLAQDAALYALVTDDVFLQEPTIVWERLEDVDGHSSTFVDSDFHPAVPVGGDVAGQTAEAALRRFEMEAGLYVPVDPADQALARQLQAEEDERARQVYARRQQTLERQRAGEEERRKRESKLRMSSGKVKDKVKNCVIM